jgi:hypothetical protein
MAFQSTTVTSGDSGVARSMQYQQPGMYVPGGSPYQDNQGRPGMPAGYQAMPRQGGMSAAAYAQQQMPQQQMHSNQMQSPAARPASQNVQQVPAGQLTAKPGNIYSSEGGQRRGADQEAQITDLMNQVESKRSELESMTMSVVQWKQTFKDKLLQEKLEIQRDAERAVSSRMQDRELLFDHMSLRMLKLYGRLGLAVAFQKLREHRKQVLWLQRVKELKTQCEALREESNISVRPVATRMQPHTAGCQRAPASPTQTQMLVTPCRRRTR